MLALPNKIDAEIARLLGELAVRDWARSCLRKVYFPTESAAERGAKRSIARFRLPARGLNPYKCKHCDGWHLTTRRQRGS